MASSPGVTASVFVGLAPAQLTLPPGPGRHARRTHLPEVQLTLSSFAIRAADRGRHSRPPEQRAPYLRFRLDVTLCIAIGTGLSEHAGQHDQLNPELTSNLEQTRPRSGLDEAIRNWHNTRSGWVRRQGLEPRTRGLRVRCSVRFTPSHCATMLDVPDVRQATRAGAVWCRPLPGRTATSEQTWSKHGDGHVPKRQIQFVIAAARVDVRRSSSASGTLLTHGRSPRLRYTNAW